MGRGDDIGFSLGSLYIFFGGWYWILFIFFSGRLDRISFGSLIFLFFWVLGRLELDSFYIFFLGSWVGWAGRDSEAGLLLDCLHNGWAAAKKLGSCWALFLDS